MKDPAGHRKLLVVLLIILQYVCRTVTTITISSFTHEMDNLLQVADSSLEGWTPKSIEASSSPLISQLILDSKTGKIYIDRSSFCKLTDRHDYIYVRSSMKSKLGQIVNLVQPVVLFQIENSNCTSSNQHEDSSVDKNKTVAVTLPKTFMFDSLALNFRNLLPNRWRTNRRVTFHLKLGNCASASNSNIGDILHVDWRLFTTIASCSANNEYGFDLIASAEDLETEVIHFRLYFHKNNDLGSQRSIRIRRSQQQPAFPQRTYRVPVKENTAVGTVITAIRVVPNSAPGLTIAYTLTPSNVGFSIDQNSGNITVTRKLDYETMGTKKYYSLWVRTSFDSARLLINVIDVNDNSPLFEQNPYSRTVPEDIMSTASILEVKATDKDGGVNGEIVYSLKSTSGGTSVFEIDEFTGQIFLGSARLNREKTARYELIVKAEDKGTPKKSSETKVIINVSDVNDNSPVFAKSEYTHTISENTKVGASLLKVTAVDEDEGTNSKLTYIIFNAYTNPMVSKFDINRLTGEISLKEKLDYEQERERVVRFTVEATDSGIPVKKGTTFVRINVEDYNDNAPIFTQQCVRYVLENAKKDDVVCTVSAKDRDASPPNNEVVYALKDPPPNLPFKVDTNTGQVKVSGPLDYDDPKSRIFEFTIVANDKGVPMKSSSTMARITLTNVNDNPPVFSKAHYEARIPETTRIGESVLVLSATDIDQPKSKEFYFSIVKGNDGNCFSISDRKILVQCSLSYDVQRLYNLTVEVKDSGALVGAQLSSRTFAIIRIIDANTHAPLFRQTSDVPSVPENAKIGTLVYNISATDLDSGENGRIAYSIVGSDGFFKINAVNGEIRTLKKLDSEKKQKHELQVMAKDHGIPEKFSTTRLVIAVIDVNDNAPIFQKAVYEVSVKEDVEIGTAIVRVRATDSDVGSNNKAIVYVMPEEYDGNGTFYIKTQGRYGTIRNKKSLDREKIASYKLLVYAFDKGTPPLNSTAQIKIVVDDVMDSPPVFDQKQYNVTLNENFPSDKSFLQVQARSADFHTDNEIFYQISRGSDGSQFTIDGINGEVSLKRGRKFDYEVQREYRFDVIAYYGQTIFTDSTVVIVNLNDLNDNKPVLRPFDVFVNFLKDKFPKNAQFKIPAEDKDVSDVLSYKIIDGTGRKYVSLDKKTGNLTFNSNVKNIGSEIDIKVQVTDGKFVTDNTGYITATMVSDEMVKNLVRIVLYNMTKRTFLSSQSITAFKRAFADAVGCSRRLVFVVGVQDYRAFLDPDTTPRVKVSVAARKTTGGSFLTPKHIKDNLYLHKVKFMKTFGRKLGTFDDGDELFCSAEACQNYGQCKMVVTYKDNPLEDVKPEVTDTVIFWGIEPQTKHTCPCPPGFRNLVVKRKLIKCGASYSLCYSNPCGQNGQCVGTDGGYACKCKEGFAGKNCQINMKQQSCPSDSSGICKNGGLCSDLRKTGLQCVCTFKRVAHTPRCELTTMHFPAKSYVSFSGLRNRWKLSISMEFSTESVNAVLFYNGRYSEKKDFIAIRINGGQVELVFSLGVNQIVVPSYVAGGVSDGSWQKVTISFDNKIGEIAVGYNCDIEMASLVNRDAQKKYCAASKASTGDMRSLDLTAPFHIGGHPDIGGGMMIPNWDFIGCIRNVYIDHVLLDLQNPLQENLTSHGCPAKKKSCDKSPCRNGKCIDLFDGFRCECDDGFAGKQCENDVKAKSPPVRFDKGSIMDFKDLVYTLTSAAPSLTTEMTIRTRQTDSVLVHQQIDGKNAYLKVVRGSLKYFYESQEMANLSTAVLSDGKWHNVKVKLDMKNIQLSQDYERHHVTVSHLIRINTKPIKVLSVGGIRQGQSINHGFMGCLQALLLNKVYRKLEGINLKPGCQSMSQCQDCGKGACAGGWDNQVCVCRKGFVGPNCQDVCLLNPCLNEGMCKRSSTTVQGFTCTCKPSYTGPRCETKVSTECADGFYGDPSKGLCGPCNCDVRQSFDPKCNKTTGECFCKSEYYSVGQTCQACGCLAEGSVNNECDRMTGQCRCKPRVIGLNCDRCMGPFEAITRNCQEINTSCPKSFSENIWWSRVDLGKTRVENCPTGTTGNATRYCDPRKSWQKPDLHLCTTNEFIIARKTLDLLNKKKAKMTKKMAIDLAENLKYALKTGKILYENDIRIGYNAISKIIEFEGNQSRYSLTSSSDGKFIKNIMDSTSRLLEMDSKKIWEAIDQVDAATVGLMQKMEKLLSILAENFSYVKRRQKRSVTTLPPYSLASKNILMELQQMNIRDALSYHFPLQRTAWTPEFLSWKDAETKVHIPPGVFNDSGVLGTEATVGLLLYRTLGKLLPSYHQDVITKKRMKVQMYSDVLTLTIPALNNQSLADNITIEFHNRKDNKSSGLSCVFWDYNSTSSRSGGWSTDGCVLIPSNGSTVTCKCNHLTSFSVVKFIELLPPALSSFSVSPLTYVSVSISMALVLFTFLTYFCLSQLRSNTNSIHKNLCAALFLAELAFIAGINRTGDITVCRIVAILLHYFFSCVFSWMLVEALHMYRMLVEKRNINYEEMTFYYFIGWGAPVIVVGVTAGLSPEGYGNDRFCWISTQGQLLWTFTAPIMAMVAANFLVFVLASCASCRKIGSAKEARNRSRLRFAMIASIVLLPLLCGTFVIGLLAVNVAMETFSLLFAAFVLVQALYIILFYVVFDKEVRDEYKNAYIRWKTGDKAYGKKRPRVKRTLLVDSSYRSQLAQLTTTFNLSTSTTDSSTDGGRAFSKRKKEGGPDLQSSTQPDSSDTSDEDTSHNPDTVPSDSSESSDDDMPVPKPIVQKALINSAVSPNSTRSSNSAKSPNGARSPTGDKKSSGAKSPPMNGARTPDWKVANQKKLRAAPLYASDGPMHSTPSDNSDTSEKRKKNWQQTNDENPALDLTEVTVVNEEADGPEDPLLSSLRRQRAENSSGSDTSEVSSLPSVIRVGPGGKPQSILKKTSKYGSATDSDSERRGRVRVRISDKQKRPLLKLDRDNSDFQDSQV